MKNYSTSGSVVKRRFFAVVFAAIVLFTSISFPSGLKKAWAEGNPNVNITYDVKVDGKSVKSDTCNYTSTIPVDVKNLVSSNDITLDIQINKIGSESIGKTESGIKSGDTRGIELGSISKYYSGSISVEFSARFTDKDLSGNISIANINSIVGKKLYTSLVDDPKNAQIPDSTLTKEDIELLYNSAYGSEEFNFRTGEGSPVKSTDKATISWNASKQSDTLYAVTGVIKLPAGYEFADGVSNTITRTVTLGASDYVCEGVEIQPTAEEYPYAYETELEASLPTAYVIVKKVGSTSSNKWPCTVTWDTTSSTSPAKTYKQNGSKQNLTWTGTIPATVMNPSDKTQGVSVPENMRSVKVTMTVYGTGDAKYSSGKVFDGDEDGNDKVGLSGSIDSSKAKTIILSQSLAAKAEFFKNMAIEGNKLTAVAVAIKQDSPTSSEKDAIKDEAKDDKSNATVPDSTYFDLSIYLATYDGDSYEYDEDSPLEKAGTSISFKYTVPDSYRKSSSSSSTANYTTYYKTYYRMYTYHDNASGVGDWEELSDKKVSFDASKFSTYAMAYYTSSSSSSRSGSGSYSGSNSTYRGSSGSGSSPVSDTIDKSGAPKTGDDFDARKWVFFLIIGVVVALCSLILYQDTKDWREDQKSK